MTPAEKRKVRQSADKLRQELRILEERLVRFEKLKVGMQDGVILTSTKSKIVEIKRRLTNLNIK